MSSAPISALPEYFALKSKSNGKYLRYDPKARGQLQFTSDELVSRFVKFHTNAVPRQQEQGGGPTTMYHLRCCYNNKYWQRLSNTEGLIAGGATTPGEDTLFKVEFDGKGIVRLSFGESGGYLGRGSHDCLVAGQDQDQAEVCEVVDYSKSVVVLPKLVAFKLGQKGKYLKHEVTYLPLSWLESVGRPPSTLRPHAVDAVRPTAGIEDPYAVHEVVTNPLDATVRIKNVKTGKFWRRDPIPHEDWIRCNAPGDDTTFDNKDTVFQVVRVEGSSSGSGKDEAVKIALKNVGSGRFCKVYSKFGYEDCFRVNASDKNDASHLWVEEPVKHRRIFDVDKRTDDQSVVMVSTILDPVVEIIPNGTSTTRTVKKKFSVSETTSTSWSHTTTWKVGGNVNVEFDVPVKFVAGLKAEISGELSKGKDEAGSNSTTTTKETEEDYTVPPMRQVRLCKKEVTTTLELPFAYRYVDRFYDDEESDTYRVEDGLISSTKIMEVIVPIEEALQ